MEAWIEKAGKYAIKEMIPFAFAGACGLAKIFPIFSDGNFKADAVLFLVFFAIVYFAWDFAR